MAAIQCNQECRHGPGDPLKFKPSISRRKEGDLGDSERGIVVGTRKARPSNLETTALNFCEEGLTLILDISSTLSWFCHLYNISRQPKHTKIKSKDIPNCASMVHHWVLMRWRYNRNGSRWEELINLVFFFIITIKGLVYFVSFSVQYRTHRPARQNYRNFHFQPPSPADRWDRLQHTRDKQWQKMVGRMDGWKKLQTHTPVSVPLVPQLFFDLEVIYLEACQKSLWQSRHKISSSLWPGITCYLGN